MPFIRVRRLFIALVVSLAPGVIGSLATFSALENWYPALEKSALTPPSFVFGPVWSALYLLTGVALYLVWQRAETGGGGRGWRWARLTFTAALILNAAWSVLFFGLQNPGAAFVDVILLFCAIAATIWFFRPLSKTASLLLVPYLLWTGFATYLTYVIWILN